MIINGKEHKVLPVTRENLYGHIHCPVNAWDCSYYDANGCCMMYPDADPLTECDDFYYFWGDDDSMDYICYENHERED